MRIGIFLLSPVEIGGGFQQALSTITAASGEARHEILALTFTSEIFDRARKAGLPAILLRYSAISRWIDALSATRAGGLLMRFVRRLGFSTAGRRLDALLAQHEIDLVVFNEANGLAGCLSEHAYITTVLDLCHRDWPEFPEVSANHEFVRRERLYKDILPRAVAVIANSVSGGRRVTELYGVLPERIIVLPFLPSLSVRRYAAGKRDVAPDQVRVKYKLPEQYIFYPAQLWAHKNHIYILDGLAKFRQMTGVALHAAFAGSDKGNRRAVEARAAALDLTSCISFLGFVPDEDIPPLYSGAMALVMPTYFGPTNLPPLEAAALGCPIIYSDFPEFREQIGGAALYCDLKDPSSLAEKLVAIKDDDILRQKLCEEGHRLIETLDAANYAKTLGAVWDDFEYLKRRWGAPKPLS